MRSGPRTETSFDARTASRDGTGSRRDLVRGFGPNQRPRTGRPSTGPGRFGRRVQRRRLRPDDHCPADRDHSIRPNPRDDRSARRRHQGRQSDPLRPSSLRRPRTAASPSTTGADTSMRVKTGRRMQMSQIVMGDLSRGGEPPACPPSWASRRLATTTTSAGAPASAQPVATVHW